MNAQAGTDKKAMTSAHILYMMNVEKMTLEEALDHVLGAGSFDKIVSDLYENFRK